MKALTVVPGTKAPSVLRDLAEPDAADGQVLIETLAVGLCGTDTEITSGEYGQVPAGSPFLILGHENLGAGHVGLPAALLGVQRGLEVHVFDRVTAGPKPGLVRNLGGTCHSESLTDSDVKADTLVECTGVASVVLETLTYRALDSVTCLTGVSSTGRNDAMDVGAVNRSLVLGNESVFGSVNANRSHHDAAVKALEKADSAWLQRLITRRGTTGRLPERIPTTRYRCESRTQSQGRLK